MTQMNHAKHMENAGNAGNAQQAKRTGRGRRAGSATALVASACALALSLSLAPAAVALDADASEQGPVPFTAATVTAGADGSYTLAWSAPGVPYVEIRADGKVVARGGSEGRAVVTGLPAADRQWFDFKPGYGQGLRLADRLVKLQGTVNFRDAGGYRTADGQWVKMGQVYRSESLGKLTEADLATLQRLGITDVYDLRMDAERTKDPDRLPTGATYTVADVLTGSGALQTAPTTPEEAVTLMIDTEKAMAGSAPGKAAYGQVLEGLRHEERRAAVVHCTAGKDRTGWAGAALLSALGVPRETVLADYLASNDYRRATDEALLARLTPEQVALYKPMLEVRPEYLDAGYNEVQAQYGSFDRYVQDGLGIDAAELKELKSELLVGRPV
ncbi:tyrosine-protein phosphatase [Streptomyces bambusae]|uniref:Protein-tyrosine-phosphatase n=1 Tax=Streptomyces bambusae TaxID=1550616 RepID=A0ABS6ZAF0_9ACTN|nr:tyrosine-protein phosphatase [Streptomyces bambusae]MBW5484203.1 protein-tyrosine-phosphatase [Streptomyces bambusae]